VGYFDINCIATARTIDSLEVTLDSVYPTVSIQMDGVMGLWGGISHALATKKPYKT